MKIPDLEIGKRFVERHRPPGRIILCAVTGSHHYGFPSADSDIDLKGIHLAPTRELLGVEDPVETRDRLAVFEGVECDYTSHEAKKALKLLLGGNGNMLERILSPIQLYETDALRALQELAEAAISKQFVSHYRGYFKGMCSEHGKREAPHAKSLLYSYRVALTGVHLMNTGELVADLNETSVEYGFPDVAELIAFKQEHGEKCALPDEMNERYTRRWPELEEMLTSALKQSRLPDTPPNREEMSDWLRNLRIRYGVENE